MSLHKVKNLVLFLMLSLIVVAFIISLRKDDTAKADANRPLSDSIEEVRDK